MTAPRLVTQAVGGCLVMLAALAGTATPGLAPVVLAFMGLGLLLAVRALEADDASVSAVVGAAFAAAAAALGTWVVLSTLGAGPVPMALVVLAVVAVVVVAVDPAAVWPRLSSAALVVLVACQGAAFVLLDSRTREHIDVLVFLTQGAQRLLDGVDPYLPGYPDIYTPAESAQVYGDGVVDADGRLTFGLPYPPVTLLLVTPAHVLGDVRYASIALALALPLVLRYLGGRAARLPAVLFAGAPGLAQMILNGWIEVLIVGLFAAAVIFARFGRWAVAAAFLGLALVSKQYFVVIVPCLWLLRPWASRRTVAALVVPAVLATLPFLLWEPREFWRSVVEFQLVQPFRYDSISLLTWGAAQFGPPPSWLYAPLPLTAGIVAGILCVRRFRPGVESFLVASSVSLFVTTAFSKQSFINYFFVIGGLVILAAWHDAAAGADQGDDAAERGLETAGEPQAAPRDSASSGGLR